MFIWKDSKKLCNTAAAYTDADGTRYSKVPADLYEEIAEDPQPEGYDADLYFRTEDWGTAQRPYIVYGIKNPEQIAEIRWNRIKTKRDDLTDNGGCLVGDKWFHTDPKSKQQQMALTMLGASLPADIMWKTMDGTFITMTPTLAQQLFAAQVAREQTIFAHAEALKADPDADINAGWPERYEASAV